MKGVFMFKKPVIGRYLSYHRHERPSPWIVKFREVFYRILGHPYLLDAVRAARVLPHLEVKPGITALDVGCGWAVWSVALMADGVRMVALDLPNEDFWEACKSARINKIPVDFVLGDGQSLPFREECFDLILGLDVFEHIPDDLKTVKEAKRVLTRKGVLVGTVPTSEGRRFFLRGEGESRMTRDDVELGHHRRYNRRMIMRLAREAGMKLEKIGYYNQVFSEFAEEVREVLRRYKVPDYLLFPFLFPMAKIDFMLIPDSVEGTGCYFKMVKER
ncbi:MAG: methyltransferase domain-containing protein [Candidatus Freyarchaeota archaeon]|nr:class I SAM-dependent methyltransferase [Candidatus Freyrarchaeum guaymaensis]